MPIYEFHCPEHPDEKLERFISGEIKNTAPLCKKCNMQMQQVEYSIPARRNPAHGLQH